MIRNKFILISTFCFFSNHLFANDISALLDQMASAVRLLNYQGTFIYQQGERLETMQITHLGENHHERELLSSLSGEAREVFRDDQSVICVIPGAASIDKRTNKGGFSSRFAISPIAIQQNYTLIKEKKSRIASQDCQNISIKPHDNLRYGYTLCIDLKTALPLRVDMKNQHNKRISSIIFTKIETGKGINMPIPQQIAQRSKMSVLRHQPSKIMPFEQSGWEIKQYPKGFKIQHYEQRTTAKNKLIHHIVLNDGLVGVSIYIENMSKDGLLKGPSKMGAINIFSHHLNRYQIIAVGEVPTETLKQLAVQLSKKTP